MSNEDQPCLTQSRPSQQTYMFSHSLFHYRFECPAFCHAFVIVIQHNLYGMFTILHYVHTAIDIQLAIVVMIIIMQCCTSLFSFLCVTTSIIVRTMTMISLEFSPAYEQNN